jgi:hypothetical protein
MVITISSVNCCGIEKIQIFLSYFINAAPPVTLCPGNRGTLESRTRMEPHTTSDIIVSVDIYEPVPKDNPAFIV